MPPVSAPRTLPSMPKVSVRKTPMHRQANMPGRPLLLDEGTFIVAEQLVRLVSITPAALSKRAEIFEPIASEMRVSPSALGAPGGCARWCSARPGGMWQRRGWLQRRLSDRS